MKSTKKILALALAAVLMFGGISVFASEPDTLAGTQLTDRFEVMENGNGDVFSMISSDGGLVIHIHEDTPVYFEDETDARERLEEGQTLAELMNNRMLVVTYAITTLSIPPQTSPSNVVIMFEQIQPFENGEQISGEIEIDVAAMIEANPLNGEVVVNGEIIQAPAPFWSEAGVVMVPLRAIAEALGYDVNWDANVRGIRIGVAINLWIGRDEYHVGRMAPIELGTAPEIRDDLTFVPMNFFGRVLAGYTAFAFEGQVVVGDAEEMDMH